jgi:hypothetical protein
MATINDTGERIMIFIDSKYRTTGTNENFSIDLTEPITRVKQAEIVTVEVPFSFYVINSTNNVLNFEDGGGTPYSIVVPEGNYSGTTFATELKTLLEAQITGWTVAYDSSIYKLRFQRTSNFKMILLGSTIATLIGLLSDSTATMDFTMQGIANLSGPNFILVRSDALTRPKRIRPIYNTGSSDILYKLAIQTGPGTTLTEKNLFTTKLKYPIRQTMRSLDFRLEDGDENPIDLNGLAWSITIVLDVF